MFPRELVGGVELSMRLVELLRRAPTEQHGNGRAECERTLEDVFVVDAPAEELGAQRRLGCRAGPQELKRSNHAVEKSHGGDRERIRRGLSPPEVLGELLATGE